MTPQATATLKLAAVILVAMTLWPIQYALWVPVVLLWRLSIWAFKVGGVAIILLFVPIIGWIALAMMYSARNRDRQAERRHRETLAAITGQDVVGDQAPSRSVGYPWMLDTIRQAAEERTAA